MHSSFCEFTLKWSCQNCVITSRSCASAWTARISDGGDHLLRRAYAFGRIPSPFPAPSSTAGPDPRARPEAREAGAIRPSRARSSHPHLPGIIGDPQPGPRQPVVQSGVGRRQGSAGVRARLHDQGWRSRSAKRRGAESQPVQPKRHRPCRSPPRPAARQGQACCRKGRKQPGVEHAPRDHALPSVHAKPCVSAKLDTSCPVDKSGSGPPSGSPPFKSRK